MTGLRKGKKKRKPTANVITDSGGSVGRKRGTMSVTFKCQFSTEKEQNVKWSKRRQERGEKKGKMPQGENFLLSSTDKKKDWAQVPTLKSTKAKKDPTISPVPKKNRKEKKKKKEPVGQLVWRKIYEEKKRAPVQDLVYRRGNCRRSKRG